MLALVTDDTTDVQPVGGTLRSPALRRGELAKVSPDRHHFDLAKPCGQHLSAIEIRIGDPEQRAPREQCKLIAAQLDVLPGAFTLEIVLGSDVVVDGDHRIRKCDDLVEDIMAGRVVKQEELVIRTPVPMDRADSIVKGRRDVLTEDLRMEAHLLKLSLEEEHLVGDGVPHRGSRVELVYGVVTDHLVATTT